MRQRRLALLHQNAAGAQGAPAVAIEGLVEQTLGGTDRVGTVDHDQVQAFGFAFAHPGDAVGEGESDARVVVAFAQFREKALGNPGDALVDVDLGDGGDALVFQYLAQAAAVAAADNRGVAHAAVGEDRRMGHHFVVDEVVTAGEHYEAVDGQQAAVVRGLVDRDGLEFALFLVQFFTDAQGEGGADLLGFFGKPLIFIYHAAWPRIRWRVGDGNAPRDTP
jgi:hypothetical protein